MRLIQIWQAPRPKDHRVGFHRHSFHELVYYESGQGETQLEDSLHPFRGGYFALLPRELPHNEHFSAPGLLTCLGWEGGCPSPPGVYADPEGKVLLCLRQIAEEAEQQPADYSAMPEWKLQELSLLVTRCIRGQERQKKRNFRFLLHYIRENPAEHYSISELSQRMALSTDYFRHRFKEETGLSPGRYILLQRLELAKRLLQEGELNCTQIAQTCGFSTSAQFSMLFRREYKISPSRFRRA